MRLLIYQVSIAATSRHTMMPCLGLGGIAMALGARLLGFAFFDYSSAWRGGSSAERLGPDSVTLGRSLRGSIVAPAPSPERV